VAFAAAPITLGLANACATRWRAPRPDALKTAPLAVAGGAAARRGSQQAGQAATLATPWQPTTANEEQ